MIFPSVKFISLSKIGYEITESVVTADQDSSLNDPAQGSFNFTAPGGNRLKLDAVLTKYLTTANTGGNFIELYRVRQGATPVSYTHLTLPTTPYV